MARSRFFYKHHTLQLSLIESQLVMRMPKVPSALAASAHSKLIKRDEINQLARDLDQQLKGAADPIQLHAAGKKLADALMPELFHQLVATTNGPTSITLEIPPELGFIGWRHLSDGKQFLFQIWTIAIRIAGSKTIPLEKRNSPVHITMCADAIGSSRWARSNAEELYSTLRKWKSDGQALDVGLLTESQVSRRQFLFQWSQSDILIYNGPLVFTADKQPALPMYDQNNILLSDLKNMSKKPGLVLFQFDYPDGTPPEFSDTLCHHCRKLNVECVMVNRLPLKSPVDSHNMIHFLLHNLLLHYRIDDAVWQMYQNLKNQYTFNAIDYANLLIIGEATRPLIPKPLNLPLTSMAMLAPMAGILFYIFVMNQESKTLNHTVNTATTGAKPVTTQQVSTYNYGVHLQANAAALPAEQELQTALTYLGQNQKDKSEAVLTRIIERHATATDSRTKNAVRQAFMVQCNSYYERGQWEKLKALTQAFGTWEPAVKPKLTGYTGAIQLAELDQGITPRFETEELNLQIALLKTKMPKDAFRAYMKTLVFLESDQLRIQKIRKDALHF